MTAPAKPYPTEVEASVEQLVYVREDEYTVARMSADGLAAFVASGRALAGVQPGETLRLAGEWDEHPRHGSRLVVERCERVVPSTVRAITLYLGSGLIRGIGPRLAYAIVSHFGERTLTVIDAEPERLREVINIGAVRQEQIVQAWAEQKEIAALMVVLQGFGISPLLAAKIYQVYGNDSRDVLTGDPYRLIGQVRGSPSTPPTGSRCDRGCRRTARSGSRRRSWTGWRRPPPVTGTASCRCPPSSSRRRAWWSRRRS